jgi:transposase
MPAIKYRVSLTEEEKEMLESLLRKGKSAARKQTRARILLKAAAGSQDAEIMKALAISATMVFNTRQRCVEEGVEAALEDRPRPGAAAKLSDRQCAHIIALACSPAPEGHGHWTLRPIKWCNWAMPNRSATRRFVSFLKKHPETLAGSGMVHPGSWRRVCRANGRRARCL